YHPQYDTERPWFEHTDDGLTDHGQQCPYVRPERREKQRIKPLPHIGHDSLPRVRKANPPRTQVHHYDARGRSRDAPTPPPLPQGGGGGG
ncbi:DUF7828 domain-containing protein, partial [Escherichia coli]|uniref:DUF7828 domain-containing protein n=1 Tax=Escherichia coli TaxID=562 RepID=UPI003F8D8DC9